MGTNEGLGTAVPEETPPSPSIFQSDLPLREKLERARRELLDLSARNRLLNVPRSGKSARTLEIVDEKSAEVFRLLVREGKTFSFVPGRAATSREGAQEGQTELETAEIAELDQPDDEATDERGVLVRHTDTKLQTRLTSQGLQKRLLDLYYDARTLEEEQGVNILFLALGLLRWVDPANSANIRHAPLILLPVSLERGTAGERFKLKWRQEDQAANLSLEAFLDRMHSLRLPVFEAGEDFDPASYFSGVADAISTKTGWAVLPDDMVLGFFSFSKFLMYRDLDAEAWPADAPLTEQPLIRSLLRDGFERHEDLLSEERAIDSQIPLPSMVHIVDSDSSQTLAVHDVKAGRNLVIQGPPGTGKSQTIANIIAAAIAEGRTVLFVAEKMAALEVVKRRLDSAGVGVACLELHSNKTNKKVVLEELRRTWELGTPKGESSDTLNDQLTAARDILNEHAAVMNAQHPVARLTPFQVVGELVRLTKDGIRPLDFELERPESWTPEDREIRERLLAELAQRVEEMGRPSDHPWRGIKLREVVRTQVERLESRIAGLAVRFEAVVSAQGGIADKLLVPTPESAQAFLSILSLARRVASAPDLSSSALGAKAWKDRASEVAALVVAGLNHSRVTRGLEGTVVASAWTTSLETSLSRLGGLPANFGLDALARLARIHQSVPGLLAAAKRLQGLLGVQGSFSSLSAIARGVTTAERVAAAPDASPEAFAAAVWERGVDDVAELAAAASRLEQAKRGIGSRLIDSAWSLELSGARQILASHGRSFLRFFNGAWRKANREVKAVLNSSDLPLDEVLALLDQLAVGRNAIETLKRGDSLGRAAFGLDWRGDRSAPGPLIALVEWVRSLRGLGAEPRLIASRLPDRAEIGRAAEQTRRWLEEARALLESANQDLDTKSSLAFDDAASVERSDLARIDAFAAAIGEADALSRPVFTSVPPLIGDRLEVLRQILAGQAASRALVEGATLGRECFGDLWMGARSDWPRLQAAVDWVAGNDEVRTLAAVLPDRVQLAESANELERTQVDLLAEAAGLFEDLLTSSLELFGNAKLSSLPNRILADRFRQWLENIEKLSSWVAYRSRAERGSELGVGALVDRLESGEVAPSEILPKFERAYFEALFADQIRSEPAIARFDGPLHSRKVREFIDLDLRRIAASKLDVVRAHHSRIPPSGGGVGPLGILRGEMARRRGHMPIRLLMQKAAAPIQALKPVLMMSPLSVAQFLPPGGLNFDLLVMDEASQIQPVDALGAIARCRQVVVVGDERQLPPTRFFAKMTGQGDEEDDDGARVEDVESILGLFLARGLPQRMLRWHYRSRHQSLIAVSNSQFYESKLFIVPSPFTMEAGMGLLFHHIPEGVFDSGNSGVNLVEAKVVAEAILRHATSSPELSLGVTAFSVRQRRAIQDQLEILRRLNPGAESFFSSHPDEPFFVKNLENVQGDERDVIFISVGYGRTAQGAMAMRFGPLSAEGGERRLNVLISRAKRRCEVFASITDEDIDLERARGLGPIAFKLFLHFARTGRLALAPAKPDESKSVFEVQVAGELEKRGYQVHPRVGIAGFFIDLAVADPEQPGRYLLGIEFDGPSYQSARSARDRDRLRRAVLEDHGWILHRIWSIDWFQRPQEQIDRLIVAIEAARHEIETRLEGREARGRAVPVEIHTVERELVTEIGLVDAADLLQASKPYIEAVLRAPSGRYEMHDAPLGILTQLVEQAVATEGPIHKDEVVIRLRSAWGLQRTGLRILSAVERGMETAVRLGRVQQEGEFLSIPGAEVSVRDRSQVSSPGLRKPEMLPPAEIRTAILDTVERSFGARKEELIQVTSRRFGFKATSPQIREAIQAQIQKLLDEQSLVTQGDLLVVGTARTRAWR